MTHEMGSPTRSNPSQSFYLPWEIVGLSCEEQDVSYKKNIIATNSLIH
jgi:hypothetical protein